MITRLLEACEFAATSDKPLWINMIGMLCSKGALVHPPSPLAAL